MSKVIIHLKGGGSYETTEIGLPNAQRLMAGNIAGIERESEGGKDLIASIDENLVVEITETGAPEVVETRLPTLDELLKTDKDVLKKMAGDIAVLENITKVNGRSGVTILANYVFDNQRKA